MNYAKEVREFVITNFYLGDGASLDDDQSFLESGVVDSTGMLELIMFLEGKYGVKVDQEEMVPDNLDSVNRVVQFVVGKLAKVVS